MRPWPHVIGELRVCRAAPPRCGRWQEWGSLDAMTGGSGQDVSPDGFGCEIEPPRNLLGY
jgi:hypothetical protein